MSSSKESMTDIARRTYGTAVETWKGEPLTRSTVDIWSKRTPRMVVSDWYLADDYPVDHRGLASPLEIKTTLLK